METKLNCPFFSVAMQTIYMCRQEKCALWDHMLMKCVFMRLSALKKPHDMTTK